MKNLLIICVILISLPSAFATCSLEEGKTACSLAEFQKQEPMQRTYSPKSTIKEFSGSPEARLKPSQDNTPSKDLRSFGPQPTDYSYNSDCQFGVCNNSGTPQLFEKRGQ